MGGYGAYGLLDRMRRGFRYWREVYRTSGWRGVLWCLNCLYGPVGWKRLAVRWWQDRQLRKWVKRMTPEQRAELTATLEELQQ